MRKHTHTHIYIYAYIYILASLFTVIAPVADIPHHDKHDPFIVRTQCYGIKLNYGLLQYAATFNNEMVDAKTIRRRTQNQVVH